MSVELLLAIGNLMTILISSGALIIALRKAPLENKNMAADTDGKEADTKGKEADTAAKYQQIARLAAEEALTLRDRIDEQDKRLEEQDKRIEELEKLVVEIDAYNTRLIHQLKSHEIEPVKPIKSIYFPKDNE